MPIELLRANVFKRRPVGRSRRSRSVVLGYGIRYGIELWGEVWREVA